MFNFQYISFCSLVVNGANKICQNGWKGCGVREKLDVSFTYHKQGVKAFIQNLFAEFKEDMKKNVFGTVLPSRREDKYRWIWESHASGVDNNFEQCHVYIWK